jgi:hypothetical protein
MKGERVPDNHHIARYIGGTKIKDDGTVSGAAFTLRAGKDDYLSVNWLEFLDAHDRSRQLAALRQAFSFRGHRVGATARFAVLNVGKLIAHVRERSDTRRSLRVQHEPLFKKDVGYDDASHAGVHGYSPEEDAIADLIAQSVDATYPAKA